MSVLSLSVTKYKIVLIRKTRGRNRPLAIHAALITTHNPMSSFVLIEENMELSHNFWTKLTEIIHSIEAVRAHAQCSERIWRLLVQTA